MRAFFFSSRDRCAPTKRGSSGSTKRAFATSARAARQVDFFKKAWEIDPKAQFYGGTSRDLVWFVRGELAKATSRGDLEKRIERLTTRSIDIREFVVGLSDIDVISGEPLGSLDADAEMVTRVEAIPPTSLKIALKLASENRFGNLTLLAPRLAEPVPPEILKEPLLSRALQAARIAENLNQLMPEEKAEPTVRAIVKALEVPDKYFAMARAHLLHDTDRAIPFTYMSSSKWRRKNWVTRSRA